MNKPMVDIAYDMLVKKKKSIGFIKIWEEICKELSFNEDQKEDNIAQFYNDLSLDDRFIPQEENKWDLRSRHTFNEVVINTSALLVDDEEENEEIFKGELDYN